MWSCFSSCPSPRQEELSSGCCSHPAQEQGGSGLIHPQKKWHFGVPKSCHSSCVKPGLFLDCQCQVSLGNGAVGARAEGRDGGDPGSAEAALQLLTCVSRSCTCLLQNQQQSSPEPSPSCSPSCKTNKAWAGGNAGQLCTEQKCTHDLASASFPQ